MHAYFFFLIIRRPPRFPLFPSATLCRPRPAARRGGLRLCRLAPRPSCCSRPRPSLTSSPTASTAARGAASRSRSCPRRSEEHTSELQSRQYLVCRLLLEKKNILRPVLSL